MAFFKNKGKIEDERKDLQRKNVELKAFFRQSLDEARQTELKLMALEGIDRHGPGGPKKESKEKDSQKDSEKVDEKVIKKFNDKYSVEIIDDYMQLLDAWKRLCVAIFRSCEFQAKCYCDVPCPPHTIEGQEDKTCICMPYCPMFCVGGAAAIGKEGICNCGCQKHMEYGDPGKPCTCDKDCPCKADHCPCGCDKHGEGGDPTKQCNCKP